jgi:molybdopterin synthase catalytic subunit
MITIQVRLFAALREAFGQPGMSMTLPDDATAGAAVARLVADAPSPFDAANLTLAINQQRVTAAAHLHDGDVLALLPPVSGGSAGPRFEITAAAISLDDLAQRVAAPTHGAITVFAGVVRGESGAWQTDYLEYEAYVEMAVASFQQIAAEVQEQWPAVTDVTIVHRVGRLHVGETSVGIAVAAAHRQGTFDACRYAIERIKAISPIWKKEVGPDGTYWVEGPGGG